MSDARAIAGDKLGRKRYAVYAWKGAPMGGFDDFQGYRYTRRGAWTFALIIAPRYTKIQVVDLKTGTVDAPQPPTGGHQQSIDDLLYFAGTQIG